MRPANHAIAMRRAAMFFVGHAGRVGARTRSGEPTVVVLAVRTSAVSVSVPLLEIAPPGPIVALPPVKINPEIVTVAPDWIKDLLRVVSTHPDAGVGRVGPFAGTARARADAVTGNR